MIFKMYTHTLNIYIHIYIYTLHKHTTHIYIHIPHIHRHKVNFAVTDFLTREMEPKALFIGCSVFCVPAPFLMDFSSKAET